MEPIYAHDCMKCVFLGTITSRITEADEARAYDLYYCPRGGLPDTVIARYGDDGPEYTSGMSIDVPPLAEARARARARGLIA